MKSVLIITQTPPSLTGLGGAMRVGNILESLSQRHAVTLALVSGDEAVQPGSVVDPWRSMLAHCIEINVAKASEALRKAPIRQFLAAQPKLLDRWPLPQLEDRLTSLRDRRFDAVVVVRLRLLPIWHLLCTRLGVSADLKVMDLDDIESRSHARQRKMLGRAKLGRAGHLLDWFETAKLHRAESQAAGEMDKLLVCSAGDRGLLACRFGDAKVALLPNCVRLPSQLELEHPRSPLRLLFIGSLDYAPNEDAVRWLVDEILPVIARRLGPEAVQLSVVGRNPPAWMTASADAGRMDLFANVPEVEPYYRACDAMVVPLRAGGGTRIKILEAFSYGRPVLATSIGAEGLGAMPNKEFLLANSADEFADSIVRLRTDADASATLVHNARALVEKNFSLDACATQLRGLIDPAPDELAMQS